MGTIGYYRGCGVLWVLYSTHGYYGSTHGYYGTITMVLGTMGYYGYYGYYRRVLHSTRGYYGTIGYYGYYGYYGTTSGYYVVPTGTM